MKNLKNWLINKLGGYTPEQYEGKTKENYWLKKEVAFITTTYAPTTIKCAKGIPCEDGDYEIYTRQEVAADIGQYLYDRNLIEWNVHDNTLIGCVRVLVPHSTEPEHKEVK